MKRILLLLLMMLASFVAMADSSHADFKVGSGSFTFTDQKGDPEKPIRVWYFKPSAYSSSTPILFVMHGMQRNAQEYRDQWVSYARQYGALLVVPEFSEKTYPDEGYAQGNMFDSSTRPIPENRSGFALVEHLFDYVRVQDNNLSTDYYLYGHSAGGQFVHRMLLFRPDARVRRAVAANPGFYTLPRFTEEFPYGLGNTGLASETIKQAFGKELTILLGDRDILENQKSLNKSVGAMKQGKQRFARGMNFFRVAQEESVQRGVSFEWKLQTVPGAGHSNSQMAAIAAQALFRSPANSERSK
jgi:pimeloyl-ACP methyl ester carboxylesterase